MRSLRVGVVVLLALAVFLVGIWVLGSDARAWSPKNRYIVKFNNVQGLNAGSIVSVAGYTIGTVRRLTLPRNINEGLVEVEIAVVRSDAHYIRADTRARIDTIGLLGDRYIELSAGSMASEVLAPGSEITAVQPLNFTELIEQAGPLTGNLLGLTSNLRKITDRWERGEGFMGALMSDTEDGRLLSDDIRTALRSIRSLGEKADRGEGVMATLVNDPKLARDLSETLATLARVTRSLETGDGLAARLLSDPAFGKETADNLNAAARELRELATRLNSGKGLVSRLATDEPYGNEVAENIRETTGHLAGITRRMAEGEGTIGKLLVDETLYRGLNDILAGASKSRLTRWFLARSQKRGAQDRLDPKGSQATGK